MTAALDFFSGDCNSKRVSKIGQNLIKLCVEYWGLLFLAHSVVRAKEERVGNGRNGKIMKGREECL